jgi:hypothetical protein
MKKDNPITFIKIVLFCFLLSFVLIYGLNHFGKISFIYDYTPKPNYDGKINMTEFVPANTKIKEFNFETYFGNHVLINGENWTGGDVTYQSEFQNYTNKCKFYIKGTLADRIYILWLGLSLTLLISILVYFKIIKRACTNLFYNINKTQIVFIFAYLVLIFLCITTYIDKQNYIGYNDDLILQIDELNAKISDLEKENEELKNENESNEYDLEKNNLEKDLLEIKNNSDINYDDSYSITQTVPYEIIQGTEFEQYIINNNSINAQLNIKGKDNVIKFLQYISRQYYLMYLSKN